MDKQYQYQAVISILQGGYPGELKGVVPEDPTPHLTSDLYGTKTYTYWYLDSNNATNPNENSSQVNYVVTDTWDVTFNADNSMTVKVHTIIESITRTNVKGNPSPGGTFSLDIIIRNSPGGAAKFTYHDPDISVAKTIGTNIDLGETTFTLQPGGTDGRGTFYIYNDTAYADDELMAGINFTNILPKDYRPGATYNGTAYMSHNRTGGVCNVYNGTAWTEMRTQDYPTGKGNPPLLYRDGDWYNQALIGQE